MKTLIWDNWEFLEMPVGTDYGEAVSALAAGEFAPVTIPHDWLITDGANLYRDGTGWYHRVLTASPEDLSGQRAFLIFDGVYMDSTCYLNGEKIGEWKYGYTRFSFEITGKLRAGRNDLMVSATFREPNSRWYSGAGIERNVWLEMLPSTCIKDGAIYISTKEIAPSTFTLRVQAEVSGDDRENTDMEVSLLDHGEKLVPLSQEEIADDVQGLQQADAMTVGQHQSSETDLPEGSMAKAADGTSVRVKTLTFSGLHGWDVDDPYLYEVKVSLRSQSDDSVLQALQREEADGRILQTEVVRIGFRTIELSPDHGLFLNHRHIKIQGVCLHSDAGALGNTYHEEAVRRQLRILQRMGVNALRLSHNPFPAEVLDLADEMGFLVMDEAFDMWRMPKTTYDYARFFDEWQARDIESFVRRDRNHPCVFLWSIGNEIYDQHADESGYEITRMLTDEVEALDPCHNARVTAASNYLPWENAQHCAEIYRIAGYNYSEKYYEAHHKSHPDWVIYGSETYSITSSRGIYHFPLGASILADEDEQCSSLGNSTTSWGAKSLEQCITYDRDLPFSMGQFIWTGWDYIGEPTPYHTRNSYFGLVDTAGFPKDAYYVFQAAWTDPRKTPMVHVFPYWDFNPGQLIDVRVCSNLPTVELFVNGVSCGKQQLDHDVGSGPHIIGDYQVRYVRGEITAVAYDESGRKICEETRHSFGDMERFVVKEEMVAKGPLHYYEIRAVDRDGYPVENAVDRVRVEVQGGELVGLDNGDSTDEDGYQGPEKRLFSGKLLAIVRADAEKLSIEEIEENSSIQITVTPVGQVSTRKLEIVPQDGQSMDASHKEASAQIVVYPENAADQDFACSVVDDNGVPTNIATATREGNRIHLAAIGDGSFHLRVTSQSGTGHVRLISQNEYEIHGMGSAYLDPYDFIYGSLYTHVVGEVGSGNEKGVATARDGETIVTWSNLDFGDIGSDKVKLWIFALSGEEYPIEIWEGIPGEDGAELLSSVIYQKPSIWNVYQPETYQLQRKLRGVTSLSIRVHQKIHIKGFTFTRYEKAWIRQSAAKADEIYGDTYEVDGDIVRGIGNNVSLVYHGMDFRDRPACGLRIAGSTPLPVNTIHLRFHDGTTEEKEILEFRGDGEAVQEFRFTEKHAKCDLTFLFLPGSNFDFAWFEMI